MAGRPTSPLIVDGTAHVTDTELYQLRYFATLGRLSASLLHEMSHPLTIAMLHLDEFDERQYPRIRHVRRNINRLHRYLKAARQQLQEPTQQTTFAVKPQVDQVRQLVTPLAQAAGVQLTFGRVPTCKLHGNALAFQHMLTNLVVNAVESYHLDVSNESARPVRVQLSCGNELVISVTDWGEGMSSQQVQHIFNPLYTTKSSGLGIGLTLVRECVDNLEGTIRITSTPRRGTRFTITLPLA